MKKRYPLAGRGCRRNGWVEFNWTKDIESVQANYENTFVTLKNGRSYTLAGRGYGV